MKSKIAIGLARAARFVLLMAAALVLFALNADAVGFRLPNQDPEAIARGNAFAATADNPSAIYYNPAGITQLEGQNLSVGLYLISASDTFTSSATGARSWTDASFQPVPQAYYTYTPKDSPLSFGVGLYVPYGLAIDWGYNPPFRNVAQSGNLLYVTLNPVVAWKITTNLSVGIGPNFNYSKAQFNQGVGAFPNDEFNFVGDAYDFGFNGGALWQPIQQLSFGVNYHYKTRMDYKGHSTYNPVVVPSTTTSTSATIDFPQYVVVGISYRPTDKWNIEFDYDWTDWDSVNSVVFQPTPLGTITLPLNYRASSMYEIGVTRKLPDGWFASVGYIYSENSVPDSTFNPIIPDSTLHLGSIGFGHKGEHIDWAFSYTLAYNPGRTVSNSGFDTGLPGTAVNGNYKTLNNALNVSANFKF